jgi:hypothetical protein
VSALISGSCRLRAITATERINTKVLSSRPVLLRRLCTQGVLCLLYGYHTGKNKKKHLGCTF